MALPERHVNVSGPPPGPGAAGAASWLLRRLALAAVVLAGGCATGSKQVATARYRLEMPAFWEVKSQGIEEGQPTTLVIGQYGSAIIDEGSGAIADKAVNYEAVQADVQVRIYAWREPPLDIEPSEAVGRLLARDGELQLSRHLALPEQPPECGLLRKRYQLFGRKQEPLDLISRPGWRTIVVGGTQHGSLVGVVARVEYEQDMGRYCHNLSNLQVQLQNVLDGLKAIPQEGRSDESGEASGARPEAPAAPSGPSAVPPSGS